MKNKRYRNLVSPEQDLKQLNKIKARLTKRDVLAETLVGQTWHKANGTPAWVSIHPYTDSELEVVGMSREEHDEVVQEIEAYYKAKQIRVFTGPRRIPKSDNL